MKEKRKDLVKELNTVFLSKQTIQNEIYMKTAMPSQLNSSAAFSDGISRQIIGEKVDKKRFNSVTREDPLKHSTGSAVSYSP
jgi:hypothetical protein